MHRWSKEIDHLASYSRAAASWYRRLASLASITVPDTGSAPGELRLVLLDEGPHALLLVLCGEQVGERLPLEHQAGREVAPAPVVDRDLGGPQGSGGAVGERPRGLESGLVDVLAFGDDAVHQADTFGLVGLHEPAGVDDVLGPRGADQPREALGAAGAGDDPQLDLGLPQGG